MKDLYYVCALLVLSSLVACATHAPTAPNNNVVNKNGTVVVSPPNSSTSQKGPKVVRPPSFIYSG